MTTHATKTALAIHGGAGAIRGLSEADQTARHAELAEVLALGRRLLLEDAAAMEVVQTCVRRLEELPAYNAGIGAVLNRNGQVELDAAIMDGATGRAGAVAAVQGVASPVDLAREILRHGEAVLLAGQGAWAFAAHHGLRLVDPSYHITAERREQWEGLRDRPGLYDDHEPSVRLTPPAEPRTGTVGAVALDREGKLAAATSTGGRANKLPGRIGDSPLIGAGTWADRRVAVSCTGEGEGFILHAVAHRVASLIDLTGATVEAAANQALDEAVTRMRIAGGLIAVGSDGHIALPFRALGMFRAAWVEGQTGFTGVFGETRPAG